MNWKQRRQEVANRIGDRRLVWFGTRGTDAHPLSAVGDLQAVFSQIAPPEMSVESYCLESMSLRRVDLNRYNIDDDGSLEAMQLREHLWTVCSRNDVLLIPYRPHACLAAAYFPFADRVRFCGLFHLQQAAFEHKPWLEQDLARAGAARIVPWRYVTEVDRSTLQAAVADGPIVVRSNISDGGAGLALVKRREDLAAFPPSRDGFYAFAPFLRDAIPLNLNACVYSDGSVALFPLSLQLIGIRLATNRVFGYCGNDFGTAASLDPGMVDEVARAAVAVGRRLRYHGYLGQFGIDFMWHSGTLYLAEVNPRFQGSSALAAEVSRSLDLPDPFVEHIAAFHGLSAPHPDPLGSYSSLVGRQPSAAQLVLYNRSTAPLFAGRPIQLRAAGGVQFVGLPAPGVRVESEAMITKFLADSALTDDGLSLRSEIERVASYWLEQLLAHSTTPW